jgi:trimethylamine--corrinoid protein Co-methyltransferase
VMGSFAQMVCDNEIAASVRRLRQGLSVNEDALAVEVIAAVMDGPRNFLGQRHTVRYLQAGEVLLPRLADRRTWEEWERAGRIGIIERAQAEAERLLAEHEPPSLTEEQERELEETMREAERELVQD